MKVEGMGQTVPVEPVKMDIKRPAAGSGGEKIRAAAEEKNQQEKPKQEPKTIERAVSLLNKTMESYNTELRFTLHKKSGEYMVKIVNTKDNTVIREIPPESVLDMVAYFKEVLGLIVDKFI